jgi:hypothetical protein
MHPRSPIRPLLALVVVVTISPGCGGRTPPPVVPTPRKHPVQTAASPAFESNVADPVGEGAPAQTKAQQSWCAYLEALYQRASGDGTRWSKLGECLAEGSTASVGMLERTAACSHKALDGFAGDPFTDAYAQEVRRCGAEALEATALSEQELEPFTSALCRRAVACGTAEYAPCLADFDGSLGSKLRRAIGAINVESRARLRACLEASACEGVASQMSSCLEPIMDRLLWLPG